MKFKGTSMVLITCLMTAIGIQTGRDSTRISKVGCYQNKVASEKMTKLLFTDVNRNSSRFSGIKVDHKNWRTYLTSLVSRCANITITEGFNVFAIHNYGECYASPDGSRSASDTYSRYGTSNNCVNSKKRQTFCKRRYSAKNDDDDDDDDDDEDDDDDDDRSRSRTQLCAGKRNAYYVYVIVSSEPGLNPHTVSTTGSTTMPRVNIRTTQATTNHTPSTQSSPRPQTVGSSHALPTTSGPGTTSPLPPSASTRFLSPQTSAKPTVKQPACTNPLDVVVAIDSSKSPPTKLFNNMKTFLVQMLPEFAISMDSSHFVVFGFDRIHYNRLTFAQRSTFYPSFIRSRINELKPSAEPTVLTAGIREAQAVLLSSGVREPGLVSRVAVLVTNAMKLRKPPQSLVNVIKELKEKTEARIVVLAWGPVKLVDKEVQVIGGNYFHINKAFTQVDLISAVNIICGKNFNSNPYL